MNKSKAYRWTEDKQNRGKFLDQNKITDDSNWEDYVMRNNYYQYMGKNIDGLPF